MSAFSGKRDNSGPKDGRKNKGVMAARRNQKRAEAEARQANYTGGPSKYYIELGLRACREAGAL